MVNLCVGLRGSGLCGFAWLSCCILLPFVRGFVLTLFILSNI